MKEKRLEAMENPAIDFIANVRARELCFDEVPETEVRFRGYPERASRVGYGAEEFADEVRRSVTYRNFSVRLRIATELIDTKSEQWEKVKGE